eukprot:5955526-Prymnesium_polylepis.1
MYAAASGSAPALQSSSHTRQSFRRAAMCKGVMPRSCTCMSSSVTQASTWAECSRRRTTVATSPEAAARNSGVRP